MPKIFADRRGVTSVEYALMAGAIALVLVEVLQVPMQLAGDYAAQVFNSLHGAGPSH